jgi:hypothetical protein
MHHCMQSLNLFNKIKTQLSDKFNIQYCFLIHWIQVTLNVTILPLYIAVEVEYY